MRKSGFLVLLLTALLVILPVVAFAAEADNSSFELSLETKIGYEEEVARLGENVTAFAVDTQPAGIVTVDASELVLRADYAGTITAPMGQQAGSAPIVVGGDALRGTP